MKRIAMLALLLGLLAGCGAEQEASALPEEMLAYTVTGDSTAQSYIRQDSRAAQFWEFTQYMNELYHNSPEYQSLPEAQGGYM